jgi:hypothetical protein
VDTPLFAFQVLICQWFYASSVALPFGAQNFSHSMKIGTYKKKMLKIDPQVLKISLIGIVFREQSDQYIRVNGNHLLSLAPFAMAASISLSDFLGPL